VVFPALSNPKLRAGFVMLVVRLLVASTVYALKLPFRLSPVRLPFGSYVMAQLAAFVVMPVIRSFSS